MLTKTQELQILRVANFLIQFTYESPGKDEIDIFGGLTYKNVFKLIVNGSEQEKLLIISQFKTYLLSLENSYKTIFQNKVSDAEDAITAITNDSW